MPYGRRSKARVTDATKRRSASKRKRKKAGVKRNREDLLISARARRRRGR